jgi:hypothetical protein
MGVHQGIPDERILVGVVPSEELTKRISKLASLEIQTGRQTSGVAKIALDDTDRCGLAKGWVVMVQALEVVDSSFVNGEQAGSETEGCQKSSLTIHTPVSARIGSLRALRAGEDAISDHL